MATYQIFDALPPHIEDALRASIERFGVLVPVVKDQHGNTIDGHHRARIADELGVEYRVDVVQVGDEDEAREIARTLNADRRQLTEDQRRAVVADLRRAGHSVRSIAGALGVGKSTVADDMAQLSAAGQLEQPERVRSRDGKSRPATRPQSPRPAPDAEFLPEPEPAASGVVDLHPAASPAAQPEADGRLPRPGAGLGNAQAPTQPEAPKFDPRETPEAQAQRVRDSIRKTFIGFRIIASDIPAERVFEVADDELWTSLTDTRDRFNQWMDEIFAMRRRQSMRAVKDAS